MKLLYAEDEPTMTEAVVDILTYHNYLVDAVSDGEADEYGPKPFARGEAQEAPCRASTGVTKLPLFQTPAPAKMRCRSLFAVLKKISACDKIARRVPYIRRLSL